MTADTAMHCGSGNVEVTLSTQSVWAPSTGESQFFALTRSARAKQAVGLTLLDCDAEDVVGSDATGGVGIARRQSCEKLRHLEAAQLWVRGEIAARCIRTHRVRSDSKFSDCGNEISVSSEKEGFTGTVEHDAGDRGKWSQDDSWEL